MKQLIKVFILLILTIQFPVSVHAANAYMDIVQAIINTDKAPEGVVFEIVNRDKLYLDWALKEADDLSVQLRHKFPHLDIAIVSHGSEQFALMQSRLESNEPLQDMVRSLVKRDIDIHVCGTLADRKGVDINEFSSLVNVSAEGPAQINDYIMLGYVKISITKN